VSIGTFGPNDRDLKEIGVWMGYIRLTIGAFVNTVMGIRFSQKALQSLDRVELG
jgi:hypothetical protein